MKKFDLKDNYTPRGFVFVPTYNCTAFCKHCNNDFKNHNLNQKMEIKKAIELLYEGKKLGLNSIQITGGEITMYPEFMLSLIPHAKKLAIRVNKPPTNAYIAKDKNNAAEFFKNLKEINYTSGFRLSIDPYHQERIPINWIADFIIEYSRYFKLSSLTIGSSYYDKEKIFTLYDELILLLKNHFKSVELIKEKKVIMIDGYKIKYGIWKPTRPSWQPLYDYEVELKKITNTMHCLGPKGVGYLWIEPDFKVRVCSCNGNNFLDYLIIGDLKKDKLIDIINRAKQNPVFKILANYGPAGLRDFLNYNEIIISPEKKYTFMCELCNEILANKNYIDKIIENYNRFFLNEEVAKL